MPEPTSERRLSAVERVLSSFRDLHGVEPVPLGQHDLRGYHHRFQVVAGWRLAVDFGEPEPRHLDVLIPRGFPLSWPKFGLVDRPPFLTWPHIERDGSLCLLANLSEVDPDNPAEVTLRLLGKSCELIQNLIAGPMVDRDLREEFLTYWRYDRNAADGRLTSILRMSRPSREITVWQTPNIRLLGDTEEEVVGWLGKRFGPKALLRSRAERGILIWLDQPLLPSEYPKTARDVLRLAERAGDDVAARLVDIVHSRQKNIVAVVAAEGRFGPGIVSATVPMPGAGLRRYKRSTAPLFDGFRPAHMPASLLVERYLGSEPVFRDEPRRADAPWIHGRGHNADAERLLGARVTVLGCGSIGAPVAQALAQAGVGHIDLVDHDALEWANVGRHPLGASAVGKNKAEEMAAKLQVDFPHATFRAHPTGARYLISQRPEILDESDLIISATGSWSAESQLNDWHCRRDRTKPVLYGWTEARAAAGHAVVIAGLDGCLRCGVGRTGVPQFQATTWPNGGSGAAEEPACGAHYQAYGPVEVGFVTNLVAQAALDCLLGKVTKSTHRLYVARRALLDENGGEWSDDFMMSYADRTSGGFMVDRTWPAGCCQVCRRAEGPTASSTDCAA